VRKYNWWVGARFRDVDASNTNVITNEKISQDVKNILPYFSYRYKFSDNQSLNFRYTTSSSQPDLNQLQPVPDNSNPNYIVIGNPDLLPTYMHQFDLSMYAFKPVSGKNMWTNANFSTTNNAFANNTSYDSIGRTTSQTVNVQGNHNLYAYLNFNWPLFSKKLMVRPNLSYNYNRSSNFINGEKNITTRSGPEFGMHLELEIDTFEFGIGSTYSNHSASS